MFYLSHKNDTTYSPCEVSNLEEKSYDYLSNYLENFFFFFFCFMNAYFTRKHLIFLNINRDDCVGLSQCRRSEAQYERCDLRVVTNVQSIKGRTHLSIESHDRDKIILVGDGIVEYWTNADLLWFHCCNTSRRSIFCTTSHAFCIHGCVYAVWIYIETSLEICETFSVNNVLSHK